MSIEEKKLLTDIIQAIDSIDDHLEGRRIFTEYKSNKTKRRAVERELEIVGEAVNKLLKVSRIYLYPTPDLLLILETKLSMPMTMLTTQLSGMWL